jgi:hypothetical protein
MIRAPASDFWSVGIVDAPIAELCSPAATQDFQQRVTWLPNPGPWRYLADPFGLRRGDATHVFVEAFDYRTKHAVIEHHELGPDLAWRGKQTVLSRPFHLSYPFIVEHEGEVFMVPESHRAGEIALYRARKFPFQWVREAVLLRDTPGAEASVIKHDGRWWMFYTLVGPNARDQRELHLAYADQLIGPWNNHPLNPVLDNRSGARPGGTPFLAPNGGLVLPVQDCSETYGGALHLLEFTTLTTRSVEFERLAARIAGGNFSPTHHDGCHTLASCGNLTLVDTKRVVRSWGRVGINAQRRLAKLGFGYVKRPLQHQPT